MYRDLLNHKIGNILLYFANEVNPLYFTKAIKLLYILDETSVKEVGAPLTWLDYKVWKFGPVPESIYEEINSVKKENCSCSPLFEYINAEKVQNPFEEEKDAILIKSKDGISFNKFLFSNYELGLLNDISKKYKNFTSKQLVDILHSEGSLWDQIVKSNDIEFSFELNDNRSNFSIDFTKLLKDDPDKQEVYKSANNSLKFERTLNSL